MPNLLTPIHNQILVAHPNATIHARGQDWLDYAIGGNQHIYTTVGGHLHYLDGGAWQEINTDFVNSNEAGYADAVTTARFLSHVDGNSRRKVYPRRDNLNEYFILGRPEYWTGSQWRNLNLPGRVRSGHQLTWDSANIAFEIQHTGRGVKYDVTLKNATNATNVRWALTLQGLTFNNWQLISNSTGQVVTQFRVPTMTDANRVTRQVAATYSGGYITFTPDYMGLAYPVVIDPTFTDGYQGDVTTYIDTMIANGNGTQVNLNYGASSSINTAYGGDWGIKSLIQFNVSSLAGKSITSGTMTLYCAGVTDNNSANIDVHRSLVQWYEGAQDGATPGAGENASTWSYRNYNGSVTWGAAGGLADTDYANSYTARTAVTTATTSYDWDITSDVTAWVGGTTNYGNWLIQSTAVNYKGFSSSDAATSNRPKLVVVYTAGAPVALFDHSNHLIGGGI